MNDDIRELLRDIRSWFTEPYFSYYDRTLVAKNLRDRIDAALKAPQAQQEPTDARQEPKYWANKVPVSIMGCTLLLFRWESPKGLVDEANWEPLYTSPVVDAPAEIARIKAGYQGCCYACEPVGELNVKLQAEIAELRADNETVHAANGRLGRQLLDAKSNLIAAAALCRAAITGKTP